MRKAVILLIFLGFYSCRLQSQSPEENLMKYWKYRKRLVEKFMIGIGNDWGASLPIAERVYDHNVPWNNYAKWGDCTAYLSMYIATLCTEYALLASESQNTDQTIKELYFAMDAINRLDLHAEVAYGLPASLNGFFIRDDVNPNMINMTTVLNNLNLNNSASQQIHSFQSDYNDPNIYNKEESKDQIIWILMAMAMVRKLIPPSTVYFDGSTNLWFSGGQETHLYVEAANISKRIISYMRMDNPSGWRWIIRNPSNGAPVTRGWDGWSLSTAFDASYIINTNSLYPVVQTQDWYLRNTARTTWQYTALNQLPYSTDQDFKIELLAAITNTFPDGYINTSPGAISYNALNLADRCYNQGYRWIPYLHKVLFEGPIFDFNLKSFLKYFLDDQRCDNTYNYGNGNWGSLYTSSSSFCLHPRDIGELNPIYPGDYNGLDYLLIHNLYYLVYKNELPPFINKYTPVIKGDLKMSNVAPYDFGSISNPYELWSWDNITAENTILSYSDVTYRASTYIDLIEGFETEYPTNFEAYIEPVSCTSGGTILRMMGNIDSIETATNLTSSLIENSIASKMSFLNKPELYIFPNPSKGLFNVVIHNFDRDQSLDIFDLKGQLLFTSKAWVNNEKFQIDLSMLTSGVYLIKIGSQINKIVKL